MKKVELLKKLGGAALKVAGITGDGGDRVAALRAQVELLELKVELLKDALEPYAAHPDVAEVLERVG